MRLMGTTGVMLILMIVVGCDDSVTQSIEDDNREIGAEFQPEMLDSVPVVESDAPRQEEEEEVNARADQPDAMPDGSSDENDASPTWNEKPEQPGTNELSGDAPRLNDLPFSDELPDFPEYRIPTRQDCDWVIEGGRAESTHGLETIVDERLVGLAYRASVAASHPLPVTFCVVDNAGEAVFGGGYSRSSNRSVFIETEDGFENLQAEFLGLTDTAEVQVSWDTKWGRVDYLGLFNIGLRGPNDSFVIRANSGIGRLIIDGCWWLAHTEFAQRGGRHASGMHIDNWDLLVWRRHKWRGETPESPGINLREHSGYLKSSNGETWIVQNDLRGGNRTGFQIRPQPSNNDRPVAVSYTHLTLPTIYSV